VNDQLGIMSRVEGLLAALGSVAGKRIIDIGCGEGEIPRALAARRCHVIGYGSLYRRHRTDRVGGAATS